MDAQHLSNRLTLVASFVPDNARLADIGSDHAYLPAALALQGKIKHAVAGEVVLGPFENAQREIQSQGLNDLVAVRHADGLAAILPTDRIDTITIAGMGGNLITKILSQGLAQLDGVNRLILQPNIGEFGLRQWLMHHHYEICAEQILTEDGHTYEIIVAVPVTKEVVYNQKQLLFGPILMKEQSSIFKDKWNEQLSHLQNSIDHMKQAAVPPRAKIEQFEQEMDSIREVLA